MCFERASGLRYRLCGCVEILEVEFVDCLLPSCRQSICHPEDCQGILCPCTIKLGPRVLLIKPPANRRCDKCELQSITPLPTKVHRSRHKRDTRERHPARQPCEVIYEVPRTKTRTRDVDRPRAKESRRPLGVSNSKPVPAVSPEATQTPGTIPSRQPSLLPPRPSNPYPPSSASSQASSGTRPPTSKATPIPIKFPSAPPSTPSSVSHNPLPIIPDPSTRPASSRTSSTPSTSSSLGSIAKTGTTGQPLPSIPWPSTAAPTRNGTPTNDSYYAPLDPLGSPKPNVPPAVDSPRSFMTMSSRSWRTATRSTTESNPRSTAESQEDHPVQSEQASTLSWSWKRTGLSRPIDGSTPLVPLPFPSTPAPPPSERRSSFTSASTRPRVVAAPFISQPTTPTDLSSRSSSKSSSQQLPTSPTPHPKRPKLGWTASSLMAVLPRVPSRSLKSGSGREASPVLVEYPISPLPSEISIHPQPRPRRSFLRNPWK
ncbi:hypothetical protein AG1IA_00414 [Rhizoctonia solani AG-1 IA]|uniref:Uncharacterized protein n=2 Tax=Rhizoctonia solani TaxID=456999 RepID=A0A8H7HDJ1_9AGAM|nr:hypothetical protein AG1IA_00414 [Rhizoctonia solani AG-1 IA]KAF8681159.1 hypothetical protein RHS04_03145 [Rhizoctonia solani]